MEQRQQERPIEANIRLSATVFAADFIRALIAVAKGC